MAEITCSSSSRQSVSQPVCQSASRSVVGQSISQTVSQSVIQSVAGRSVGRSVDQSGLSVSQSPHYFDEKKQEKKQIVRSFLAFRLVVLLLVVNSDIFSISPKAFFRVNAVDGCSFEPNSEKNALRVGYSSATAV